MSTWSKAYIRNITTLLGIGMVASGRLPGSIGRGILLQITGLGLIIASIIWWYNDYFGKK